LYGERERKVWEFVRFTSSDLNIPRLQDQTGCSIVKAKWKPWSLISTSCFRIFIVFSPLHVRIKSYRRTVFRRRIYIQKVAHLELRWNSHLIWKQHYHCYMRGVVGVFAISEINKITTELINSKCKLVEFVPKLTDLQVLCVRNKLLTLDTHGIFRRFNHALLNAELFLSQYSFKF